ncbi:response regulator, partial [Vibrio parahaemolyticus]
PAIYGIDLGIPLEQRRVLVADHSAFNRRTLARFLTWAGIQQVEFAASGLETLAKVIDFQPDLLLLDVVLPEMDGIEVCKRLRQDPVHADL